jgi:hypothetical protein
MTRLKWQTIIEKEYVNSNQLQYPKLLQKFQTITNIKIKMMTTCLYLFGARIGEICHYKQDKKIRKACKYEDDEFITVDNKKIILHFKGDVIKEGGETKYSWIPTNELELEGVKPDNFQFVEKIVIDKKNNTNVMMKFLQLDYRNEKNKKRPTKIGYAPYQNLTTGKYYERELIDELMDYVSSIPRSKEVFPRLRRTYNNLLTKYAPDLYYLHFLRALRCCVLIYVYGFEEFHLVDFMGWTNSNPLKYYRFLFSILDGMSKMASAVNVGVDGL